MADITLTGDQYVFFILLIKMGVMAVAAVVLISSSFFKRLIFLESRTTKQNIQLALIFGLVLLAGSALRVLVGYEGTDLTLSGTVLAGLMSGMVPGMVVGAMASLPALLHGEWVTLPFAILCGLLGGVIRRRAYAHNELWDFSPFPVSNFVQSIRILRNEKRFDTRTAIFVAVLVLEIARTLIADRLSPQLLFAFRTEYFLITICVWFSTLACVGIPVKIWNNTRVEVLLEEQRTAAVQARFDALRSQINPHFFFNTLNAATSCIWSEPEKSRWILVKLSGILRRLFYGTDDFVPLSAELEFIEDYLSLERARFGEEKIKFEKEIDPRALDIPVPSMILQPLVENAVKHGLSQQIEGGSIRITAQRNGERLMLRLEDNGAGFSGSKGDGIGLSNVRERLKVAYGRRGSFDIESAAGKGTIVKIELPVERVKASV